MKYIIVTGGVVSGLGKGITISSIGRVLIACGIRITAIKIDPYLNIDAGTMSPFEHGETFVLDDGGETDLDLGNYERFLDLTLTARHNITTGKIYRDVIQKERRGDYLGKTVQIVPHLTDVIQEWIRDVARQPVDGSDLEPEVCLIEVGGTVGDIESMVFLEALRQMQFAEGKHNCMLVHLSLVPSVGGDAEQKTKPTQHSVKELRSIGLFPDLVVCRCSTRLAPATKAKLSTFCQVKPTQVLSVHDVSNIYFVPLVLVEQDVHLLVKDALMLHRIPSTPNLSMWDEMAQRLDSLQHTVVVAIVGKYTGHGDAYLSVVKSLTHSGVHLNTDIQIVWVDSSDLEETTHASAPERYEKAWSVLKNDVAGIIVPGGFGIRGIEGKVAASKYAREKEIPYLGLCLGMQVMVIEYCRHVMRHPTANSLEFDESTAYPAVVFMPEANVAEKGGTMRLGARNTHIRKFIGGGDSSLQEPSIAWELYGLQNATDFVHQQQIGEVWERHRHRYEVNPAFVDSIEKHGLYFSGTGAGEFCDRMEIAELPRSVHPYYIAAQFHPEFKSRPNRPAPLVFGFIAACLTRLGIERPGFEVAGQLWQASIRPHVVFKSDPSKMEDSVHRRSQESPLSTRKKLKRPLEEPDFPSDGSRLIQEIFNEDVMIEADVSNDCDSSPSEEVKVRINSESVAGVCSPIKPWNKR